MNIHPIESDSDYQEALAEIEVRFDAAPNSTEADRLEILATLVEAYEDRNFSIPAPDPIEAIKYFMESRGLTRKDLESFIGNRSRVSEILNRKRPLTLQMIRKLHRELGIPAEVLLSQAEVRDADPMTSKSGTVHGHSRRAVAVHEKQKPFKKSRG